MPWIGFRSSWLKPDKNSSRSNISPDRPDSVRSREILDVCSPERRVAPCAFTVAFPRLEANGFCGAVCLNYSQSNHIQVSPNALCIFPQILDVSFTQVGPWDVIPNY